MSFLVINLREPKKILDISNEKKKEKMKKPKEKKDDKTRVYCECGGKYLHCHKIVHFRTKKHKNWADV
jgi:hypothetical protein